MSDSQQQQQQPQKPGVLKIRRLSVLQVQDNDYADLTRQQKLRRKSVVGEPKKSTNGNDDGGAAVAVVAGGARGRRVVSAVAPTKLLDPKLAAVPNSLQVPAGSRRRILVSAVPLPDGVDCIDTQDDLFFTHWPEFISYAK